MQIRISPRQTEVSLEAPLRRKRIRQSTKEFLSSKVQEGWSNPSLMRERDFSGAFTLWRQNHHQEIVSYSLMDWDQLGC